MLELLAYLRTNGFKTFIVSGGGIEFMRPWAEQVYGIPPEQVIGSSVKAKFELRDGQPVLVRLPELNFIDDKGGKPVGINQHIGRRPIAAFGNSAGDREMLEYTQGGSGARIRLRSSARIAGCQARRLHAGARRACEAGWLDRGQHEGRLETSLRV